MLSARGFSSSSQVGDSSKFPAGEVKDARDAHGATKPALVDKVNDKKNVADSKFDSNPIHYLGYGVEHFKDRRLRDHFSTSPILFPHWRRGTSSSFAAPGGWARLPSSTCSTSTMTGETETRKTLTRWAVILFFYHYFPLIA